MDAREAMKRLEHTIYVTLKYTRTVDVIRITLNRLINIFDLIIEALLDDAKEKKLIDSVPKSPSLRSTLVTKTYQEDERLSKFIEFYSFLRDILKSKYTKREEYRRHVTLVANLGNKSAELDIDNLETCEIIAHQFYKYAKEFIEGKPEEEEYD